MVDFSQFPEWEQVAFRDRIHLNTLQVLGTANEQLQKAGLDPVDNTKIPSRPSAGAIVFCLGLILGSYLLIRYVTRPTEAKRDHSAV